MSKHSSDSGLMQLRTLFPSKAGFHIDPMGNNAGDVWKGTEHVGWFPRTRSPTSGFAPTTPAFPTATLGLFMSPSWTPCSLTSHPTPMFTALS